AGGRALAESRLRVGFAAPDFVEVVAYADDLRSVAQIVSEVRHDRRLELDRPGLALDVRRMGLRDQPIVAPVDPGVETVPADELDRLGGDVGRQGLLLND